MNTYKTGFGWFSKNRHYALDERSRSIGRVKARSVISPMLPNDGHKIVGKHA